MGGERVGVLNYFEAWRMGESDWRAGLWSAHDLVFYIGQVQF